MDRGSRWIDRFSRAVAGGGLAAFALSLLFFYELALGSMLLVPPAPSGLGAFAEEFRTWCFGYDPATGSMNWAWASTMFMPPLLVGAAIGWLWWAPLRALLARPAELARPVLLAVLLAVAASASFAIFGSAPARGELPFPAEALRTAFVPPALRLTNQAGETVDLAALRGKVVLLTGVYASCPHTCPLILTEAKRVVGSLTEREKAGLRVIAITLDPAKDSPEVLAELAGMHGMKAPLYQLVTGGVPEVERTLDGIGVSRQRDPKTGVINHANLFILVDRQGRIAYRLTLGPRQERWLGTALRLLLGEPPHAG